MPVIRLPDGSERSFDAPVSVADVAMNIGEGLAKAALAGKVNGTVVDTSYIMEADSDLAIITARSDEGLEVIRHSAAHLLAYAVKELFPDAQVTIGPVSGMVESIMNKDTGVKVLLEHSVGRQRPRGCTS